MQEIRLGQPRSLYTILNWEDSEQVAHWAGLFGISQEDLQDAVARAGPRPQSIEVFLKVVPTKP